MGAHTSAHNAETCVELYYCNVYYCMYTIVMYTIVMYTIVMYTITIIRNVLIVYLNRHSCNMHGKQHNTVL